MVDTGTISGRLFYHGSPNASHLSPSGLVMPRLPRGGDQWDPKTPHIFLTPDKAVARIYSAKIKGTISVSNMHDIHVLITNSKPVDTGEGWVYAFREDPRRPFEEVFKNGKPSDEYVSYHPLDPKQQRIERVGGIAELMRTDNLQVLYLAPEKSEASFLDGSRKHRTANNLKSYIGDCIADGTLIHVNAETGNNPYDFKGKAFAARRPLPHATATLGTQQL